VPPTLLSEKKVELSADKADTQGGAENAAAAGDTTPDADTDRAEK
jgi:hypothetical protein